MKLPGIEGYSIPKVGDEPKYFQRELPCVAYDVIGKNARGACSLSLFSCESSLNVGTHSVARSCRFQKLFNFCDQTSQHPSRHRETFH